jgi:hypothetical protein
VLAALGLIVGLVGLTTAAYLLGRSSSGESNSSASDTSPKAATEAPTTGTSAPTTPVSESPEANPDDPRSYYATDGSAPSLFPDCNGALGLCLGNPSRRAVSMFGPEEQRYAGVEPGSIVRQWQFDGMLVSVEADRVRSVSSVTVSVGERPKPGLRVALLAGYPQAPIELVLGPLTMGEVESQMGKPVTTESFAGENVWFHTYLYRAGPEGVEAIEFTNAKFGKDVGFGPKLDSQVVTSFTVKWAA